jgi:hypothetical protein
MISLGMGCPYSPGILTPSSPTPFSSILTYKRRRIISTASTHYYIQVD